MNIYKFALESFRVIRRRNWAKRAASQYLKPGKYTILPEHKGFIYNEASTFNPLLYLIGHTFTVKPSKKTINGTKVLFATMGGEMRILDQKSEQLVTIFHDKQRLEYLLAKRSINLPLKVPSVVERLSDLAFSEELISTPKLDFVSCEAYKKLLKKYLAYYKKLPKDLIRKKLAPQHRDLHKDNILWVNNDPQYFIDFEDVKEDWYLRDLITLMMYEGTASNNWHLLDNFFAGTFDAQFTEICSIFNDTFSTKNHFEFLSRCINDRYHHVDLSSQPELKQRIAATIKRYKNRSNKKAPKYCIFSTADENYALYAGASLLSMQVIDPTVDIFVVGKKFSAAAKTAFSKNGINYIELSDTEQVKLKSDYVAESYYYFSMPEYFLKQGYDYSAYIDADILAVDKFQQGFPEDKAIAGTTMTSTTYSKILKDKLTTLQNHYTLKVNLNEDRIHSGVLFFNNKLCAQIELKKNLTKLAHEIDSIFDTPIRDNELFTIFQAIHGNTHFDKLPEAYNYIEDLSPYSRRITSPKIRLYHFTYRTPKPWNSMSKRRILWLFGAPYRLAIARRWQKYRKEFLTILQGLTRKNNI